MFGKGKKNGSPLVDFYANDHRGQLPSVVPEWQIGSPESCSGNARKDNQTPVSSIYNSETPVPFLWDGSD
jgi:hypothetical protein